MSILNCKQNSRTVHNVNNNSRGTQVLSKEMSIPACTHYNSTVHNNSRGNQVLSKEMSIPKPCCTHQQQSSQVVSNEISIPACTQNSCTDHSVHNNSRGLQVLSKKMSIPACKQTAVQYTVYTTTAEAATCSARRWVSPPVHKTAVQITVYTTTAEASRCLARRWVSPPVNNTAVQYTVYTTTAEAVRCSARRWVSLPVHKQLCSTQCTLHNNRRGSQVQYNNVIPKKSHTYVRIYKKKCKKCKTTTIIRREKIISSLRLTYRNPHIPVLQKVQNFTNLAAHGIGTITHDKRRRSIHS